jgi:hypothetical protein
MSLRQLRARLNRLEARFPEDEESIARARYEHLRLRIARGEMELLTYAEKGEYSELFMSLCVHLPPATTDEDRAARARWNDLRRKLSPLRGQTFESLTEAEETEYHELSTRYHFLGDAIKAWRDEVKKLRAEGEERSRSQQLERQKKAAAAARIRSGADSSYCPGEIGGKEASKVRQVEPKRDAAAAAGVINYEDNSDCWPIDDDDDL